MRPRWIVALCLLSALGGVVPVIAQASGERLSPARTEKTSPSRKWTAPRTAWGDPDLTGVYSNDDESGMPFERPPEFSGRAIEDVTSRELAEINRQREARFNATLAGFGSTLFPGSLARRNSRPWMVVDPPDGHVPPLTPEARERLRHPQRGMSSNSIPDGPFDGYEDLGLYDRCITRGIPDSMMPVSYGGNYEIIQSKGQVAIRYEMIHEVRVIPLDGRPPVGQSLHLDLGDARGRWESDTLVVESTNFSSRSAFRGATGDLRLTERFTPTDQGHVEWRVTVNDARTWTRPWSFGLTLTRKDSSQRIYEYACHEGNYGLRNILAGARSADEVRQEK
jgi:hypothetical protein